MLKRFRFTQGNSTKISQEGFSDLSHPHLVNHLGGWVSENELFLIFPAPVLTLKNLLRSPRSIYRTEEGIDSVLRQLAGIADAISYLGQLQDSGKGFHHGIRPDNIYLFPIEHNKDLYNWKLGSFGTDSETFDFSEKTTTNVEPDWSRKYRAPENRDDPEHPPDQTPTELDVWSLGCILVEVLHWLLENGDQKPPMHPCEMWKPGEPFWEKNLEGTIDLQASVAQFLEMISDFDSFPQKMKRIAYLASMCLEVYQAARGRLDLANLILYIRPNTARSVFSRAAELEREVEDLVLPYKYSSAPSRTRNPQSLASSPASMKTDEPASLHESAYSSSYIQTNAIDGWSIAELGLGVEPYMVQGYRQSLSVNAAFRASQRPLSEYEETSTLKPRKLVLPNRTLATGGAMSLASDQSLDQDVGKSGGNFVQKQRTENSGTEDAVEQNPVAEKRAAFVRGLISWGNLSSEEQKACIGPKLTLNSGYGICYEPEGLLKEFWETYLHPRFQSFLRDDDSHHRDQLRHRSILATWLVVLQKEMNQQHRPTIIITSDSKDFAERLARRFRRELRKKDAMPVLASSFDIVADSDIVQNL